MKPRLDSTAANSAVEVSKLASCSKAGLFGPGNKTPLQHVDPLQQLELKDVDLSSPKKNQLEKTNSVKEEHQRCCPIM